MEIKTIIVTGFEPFGSYQDNPTQDLTERIKNKTKNFNYPKNFNIIALTLPCEYYGAFEILKGIIVGEKPHAIISTGLSSRVKGVRIENRFENMMNSKYPDATGFQPKKQRIEELGNEYYYSDYRSNIFFKQKLSSWNIPIEFSNNAENFICNSLGYLTSKFLEEQKLPTKNMFLHIPWTDNYRSKVGLGSENFFLEKEYLHRSIDFIINNI